MGQKKAARGTLKRRIAGPVEANGDSIDHSSSLMYPVHLGKRDFLSQACLRQQRQDLTG
jgi:hypothetical protein